MLRTLASSALENLPSLNLAIDSKLLIREWKHVGIAILLIDANPFVETVGRS
ncbi:hypothetical protein [Candidatus Rickettsia kedanie]|uniref:Uncharacterized protein n=1 Tax=Candidatus Rickettsia kedanie TaxID=3115352 RepID=A0ABP9TSU2_9RICK